MSLLRFFGAVVKHVCHLLAVLVLLVIAAFAAGD